MYVCVVLCMLLFVHDMYSSFFLFFFFFFLLLFCCEKLQELMEIFIDVLSLVFSCLQRLQGKFVVL